MSKRPFFRGTVFLACTIVVLAVIAYAGQNWPDLTVLDNYPNPTGNTCEVNGAASKGSEKAKENQLKNRFKLPPEFKSLKLEDFFKLPLGPNGALPGNDHPKNNGGVSVAGYVQEVKPGGTKGESCNCNATKTELCDAHIELVMDSNNTGPEGKGMVVVEVTERSRRLAKSGLLKSNIGNDWSTKMLRAKLLGRWVRFGGWLFYDPDHHNESWQSDPKDKKGKKNWRGTCWEVHPVMQIEKLPGVPH